MSLLVGAASNAAGGGYTLDNSLRFRSSASAYLNRLPTVAGNRKTWTWSCWVKRGKLGVTQGIMGSAQGTSTSYFDTVFFDTNDKLYCRFRIPGAGDKMYRITTQVFRDPSAWYHLVFQYDTDGKTASPDNFKIYVNNELITSYVTTAGTLTTDWESFWNGLYTQVMGRRSYTPAGTYLDGYMAEVNSVDGQALDPTNFGEYDEDTGAWIPKAYTGSYGTNGFYLDFEDTSSVAALGTDTSGNSNDFTPTNISLTSGATYDSMTDVPTLTNENTSNFCVLNPLQSTGQTSSFFIDNGNLDLSVTNNSAYRNVSATFSPEELKGYFEILITGTPNFKVGFMNASRDNPNSADYTVSYANKGAVLLNQAGNTANGPSTVTSGYLSSFSTGDVIGCAFDFTSGARNIWWSKNNTWGTTAAGTGNPSDGSNPAFTNAVLTVPARFWFAINTGAGLQTISTNFGQRPFTYTPPTGFKKLNTFNLPDSTITDGSTNFNTVTYTGDGTTGRDITGFEFSPDLVWIKDRTVAYGHLWFDTIRGATVRLSSNSTGAEVTTSNSLTAFNSDGFSIDDWVALNANTKSYVAWNWKAASTAAATYVVKVVSDSGNKYRFDDFGTSAVTLNLHETGTYTFDQSDSSNSGHPLRFSSTSDGTHGGGSEYTTGVTVTGTPGSAGAKTVIVVAASAPTLYYYCSVHSGMGGQANTNVTKGSSNFDGTIVSTVSANPTAGFSIVSYTANNGVGGSVGHGLNQAPDFVIAKSRDSVVAWVTYHSALGANKLLVLSSSSAAITSAGYWGTPDSSTFGVSANTLAGNNYQTDQMIAYCFADVEGYSKFGSYTGNGSTNGTFLYTGFKPKMVIIKTISAAFHWVILDTERNPENLVHDVLYPSLTNAEADATTFASFDAVSNGFKLRNSHQYTNYNGYNYIYMAFAENPFKNSTAR